MYDMSIASAITIYALHTHVCAFALCTCLVCFACSPFGFGGCVLVCIISGGSKLQWQPDLKCKEQIQERIQFINITLSLIEDDNEVKTTRVLP
jgi:hypothetical protein